MFKYLVMSDIHLGHRTNKCKDIISNLEKFFIDYRRDLKNLNVIFLAGDVFDRLLSTHSTDYILANLWITELVKMCKTNNIALRVLEGTPSHDWKQCSVISKIIDNLDIDIDYKYIDTLYIEKMDKYGISVLYVPDEYRSKSIDTIKEIKEYYKKEKIDKVDIAIMHGCFRYQLPIELDSMFKEQDMLDLVNYYISIGHIHTSSMYDRILAQGSFDRLAHGEEEDKGAMLIAIDKLRGNWYKFLKNNNSKIFKTITIDSVDIDTIIKEVSKVVNKIKEFSYIRIISNVEHANLAIKELNKKYPTITFKLQKSKDVEDKKVKIDLNNNVVIESISITKDNIETLLLDCLSKYKYTKDKLDIFKEELLNAM